ncbi:hypothetical protein M885DRAFT_258688 [Pelagophyceae sp. CCMP2097]|nr:hypothetical protein M885DRAFT_258688 [Pelagophyceae sp. CCMP2097]
MRAICTASERAPFRLSRQDDGSFSAVSWARSKAAKAKTRIPGEPFGLNGKLGALVPLAPPCAVFAYAGGRRYARYRTQVFDERVLGRPRVEMHIARPLDWAEMPQCHRVAWDLASGPRRPCDAVFVKLVNRERAEAQRLLDAGEFAQGSVLAEIHADLRAALTEEHQVAVVESGRERRA